MDKNDNALSPEELAARAALMDDTPPEVQPLLTVEELEAIKAEAFKKVTDERKAAARKQALDAAIADARQEQGRITGDGAKDELVMITLDLAEHSDKITLNGAAYWHGHTYKVPRHQADTLRDIQFRGWKHQMEIDGKNAKDLQRQAPRNTLINARSGAVSSAPQQMV